MRSAFQWIFLFCALPSTVDGVANDVARIDVDHLRRTLETAVSNQTPRPDLVLLLIEHEDASLRTAAIQALANWHVHIPTAIGLLRRTAADKNPEVRLAAIMAGVKIGTNESLEAIVDAMNDTWSRSQASLIFDAVDTREHRKWWKSKDEHGLRETIERLRASAERHHLVDELLQQPIPEPNPDVIASGRHAFIQAKCDVCHRVAGYGRPAGPDLKNIGSCFDNQQLIHHILDPSLDIHDVGRGEMILLEDGRLRTGQIVLETEEYLMVRFDPMNVDATERIDVDQIVERRVSPISPMPTGLLNALSPTEVADLVSFLRSNGGQLSALSHPHHH